MNNIIEFTKSIILKGLTLSLNMTKGRVLKLSDCTVEETDNTIVCTYAPTPKDHLDHAAITAKFTDNSVIFSLDIAVENEILSVWSFNAEKAITIDFSRNMKPDSILGSMHPYLSSWWTFPTFNKSFDELNIETQNILVREEDRHIHLLPLCNGNFRCEFDSTGLHITPGTAGIRQIKGDFISVSVADDPYKAVKQNYASARDDGAISVPLKTERELPEMFRGFGWCTWNTFYHDVTSAKIYEKLEEFKSKNIPVKW